MISEPCTCQKCIKREIFGAMRRAVTVARNLESQGWFRPEADAIRWAIRSAITKETT